MKSQEFDGQKYWQGEICNSEGEPINIDFPRRETREEAFRDADLAVTDCQQTYRACEWVERYGGSESTGEAYYGSDD